MKNLLLIGLLVGLADVSYGQCYHYRNRGFGYVAPFKAHYVVPHVVPQQVYAHPVDNAIRVTYNISFPPPAATGNTIYGPNAYSGYGQDALNFYNPAELYKQRLATAQRGMEMGANLVQSADLLIAQANEQQLSEMKLKALEAVERFFASNGGGGGGASLQLRSTKEYRSGTNGGAVGGSGNGADDLRSITSATMLEKATYITKNACVSCHQPGGKYAKLDLRDLSTVPPEKWERVVFKVLTDEPSEIMPPPDSGIRLTAEQKLELTKYGLTAMSIAAANQQQKPPPAAHQHLPTIEPERPPPIKQKKQDEKNGKKEEDKNDDEKSKE